MICEKCKTPVADTAKFCPKCGNKIENVFNANGGMRKCPQCGAENPAAAKFCKVDGYNFQKTETGKAAEKPVESERPKDKLLCPKCGTSYDIGVKFCKKDGAKLQQGVIEPAKVAAPAVQKVDPAPQPVTPKPTAPKPSAEPSAKAIEEIKQLPTPPKKPVQVEAVQPQAAPKPDGQKSPAVTEDAVKKEMKQTSVPLERKEKVEPPSPAREQSRRSSKGLLVATILVLLIIAGAGSYLYFSGFLGKNPAKVGEQITGELTEKGLSVSCEIDKNWTATLKGTIRNAADKDVATGIVNAHKEVKDLKYDIQMPLSPSEVKAAIDNALRDGGIRDIHAEVDDNLTVTLQGFASDANEKENAMKIASGLGKAKDVRDNIQVQPVTPPPVAPEQPATTKRTPRQDTRPRADVTRKEPLPQVDRPDPAKTEGELNRALRNAGLRGITAEVGDDLTATLKGSTNSADDKNRAFDIARSFNGIKKVRDRIFVVR